MLHVWLVPSPDGAFAGTNPNLPFWSAGLSAPDSARMRTDSAFNARAKRASLALAEVTDTTSIFPNLERRPELQPVLAARRDSIRVIVGELRAAEKAKDAARWDRALDSNSSPAPLTPSAAQQVSGGGTRVLIVDDHPAVANGLSRLLRLLGYDVRAELNPVDAVVTAKGFRPQFAVLDIGLPTMDGYALAEELRAHLGDMTPVLIALSGYDQPEDRRRSHASGFATHLVKPVDVDDLVGALSRLAPS